MAKLGADVVGFDFSSGVYEAERRRQVHNLEFVRGDLMSAGLKDESFDAALSIGVIMCTPNTYRSFSEICRLVKPGGRFYVWVYRRPETFFRRHLKHPLMDLARLIISRLPDPYQAMAVKSWASLIFGIHKLYHGEAKVPYSEYVVSSYDDMTPQWRRYHTAYELSDWFYKNGFASPTLSHWDNPYGFGLVAIKFPQTETPGIHYGNAPKLLDDEQTVLG
jgi:ubiquinone/menaquinone biosynthesis C-methylase UbiE